MRKNKGQSTIQYATLILVIVALVGSWMAYANAGTAKGATKKEVKSATKGLATKSDLKDLAKESTLKSVSKDVLSAIRGRKKITETEVVEFLSGKSWSDAKTFLDRAGVSVPKKKVTKTDIVDFLSGKDWSSVKPLLEKANITVPAKGGGGLEFPNLTVHFFPGGTPGGSFAAKVAKGAKAAEEDLGVEVKYKWSEWKPSKFVMQFKKSVAAEPDAICMMGHAGYKALKDPFQEAREKGIVVTFQNVDVPKLRKGSPYTGYVGQKLYGAGHYLATSLVERNEDIKKGDKAVLISTAWEKKGRNLRPIGVENGLQEKGIKTTRIELSEEAHESASKAAPVISGYLAKHPDTKIIFLDHFEVVDAIRIACQDQGIAPEDIYGIGFDLNPSVVKCVQKGYVDLVSDQQPFLQGYLPILNACLSAKYKFGGLFINTGRGLVSSKNIEPVAPLVEKGIR